MINVQDEYRGLLSGILYGGAQKEDRTNTGTQSVFGRMLRHDMGLGFPLLTTKKIYFKHAVTDYYGYYKVVLIFITFSLMVLVTGMLIIIDQVELTARLVLFMASSLGTLMVLISLNEYSSKLKKSQARGALWQAYGIPMIWMIWCYLLATMVFKYI